MRHTYHRDTGHQRPGQRERFYSKGFQNKDCACRSRPSLTHASQTCTSWSRAGDPLGRQRCLCDNDVSTVRNTWATANRATLYQVACRSRKARGTLISWATDPICYLGACSRVLVVCAAHSLAAMERASLRRIGWTKLALPNHPQRSDVSTTAACQHHPLTVYCIQAARALRGAVVVTSAGTGSRVQQCGGLVGLVHTCLCVAQVDGTSPR